MTARGVALRLRLDSARWDAAWRCARRRARLRAVLAAFAGGYFVIRRGVILEPPAFISDGISALTERITKRLTVTS